MWIHVELDIKRPLTLGLFETIVGAFTSSPTYRHPLHSSMNSLKNNPLCGNESHVSEPNALSEAVSLIWLTQGLVLVWQGGFQVFIADVMLSVHGSVGGSRPMWDSINGCNVQFEECHSLWEQEMVSIQTRPLMSCRAAIASLWLHSAGLQQGRTGWLLVKPSKAIDKMEPRTNKRDTRSSMSLFTFGLIVKQISGRNVEH